MESLQPGFKAARIACGVTMIVWNLTMRATGHGIDVPGIMLGTLFGIGMMVGIAKQSRLQLRVAAWIVSPLLLWLFFLERHDPWWLLGLKITFSLAMLTAIRRMYGFLPERLPKDANEMNTIDPEHPDPWEKW